MVSNELEQDLKEVVNTVPIPKHNFQQLLSWIREIEEIAQFIDDDVFEEPYGSLEHTAKITKKNLRKMRKLITAALRRD